MILILFNREKKVRNKGRKKGGKEREGGREEGKEIIVKIYLCISRNDWKFQILKIMLVYIK